MIIAVTGTTSFICQKLIARHLAMGDEVRYLTRSNIKPIKNATAFIAHVNSAPDLLLPFLNNADIFYHCAAEIKNESLMHSTNVQGTANLLNLALLANVKRWVQLSSTGVYGSQPDATVVEETIPKPNNAYEVSKLAADFLVIDAVQNYGLDAVIIRPSNVYGKTMTNQSLFGLINMVNRGFFFFIGKKGAIANYTHVDNLVDAMVLAAVSKHKQNASIYIVSDQCTMETFINFIANTLAVRPPKLRLPASLVRFIVAIAECIKISPLTSARIDALTRTTVYSAEKITKELGYMHKMTIEDGVTELVKFWSSRK